MIGERIVDRLVAFVAGRGQVDRCLGAAIAVAALVVENAATHGLVRGFLVGRVDRRRDGQPARIGFVLVLLVHHLPHHLGDVLAVHRVLVARRAHVDLFLDRFVVLRLRDVADVEHALQDVFLTHLRALRIDDRVIGGRRLRQPREHRRFRERDVLQVLAEVHARRGRETVRSLAEIDLVHVQLEDLVLRQGLLDLVREQHFVDLARVGLLARQEEVARDLHRDRARALARAAVHQVGHARAQDADEIDAAVLVEAVVLDREHGLLHHVGNILEAHEAAALLAELADQHVVGGEHAQRHLRLVVRQRVERRQLRRHHDQRVADDQRADHRQGREQADEPQRDARAERAAAPSATAAALLRAAAVVAIVVIGVIGSGRRTAQRVVGLVPVGRRRRSFDNWHVGMAGVRGALGRMRKCKRMNQSGCIEMRLSRRQTPPRGDPFPRRDSAF
ncbi:hypothetical protein BURCENK562V_C1174 [Burkholderia cenocepacia K56-2Valvano]|nr:hypothetical protein BURCENK562V_C1174 [Burkholderia cenocepacia K56-2Valvano]